MSMMVSQSDSLMIVYSTIYSGADQRKHQSSTSLAFVRGIHQWLVNSLHKGPVMRKMFPFDDVIMHYEESVMLTELVWDFHIMYMVVGHSGHILSSTQSRVTYGYITCPYYLMQVRYEVWRSPLLIMTLYQSIQFPDKTAIN